MVKKVASFTPEASLFEKRLFNAQSTNTRVGWVKKIHPRIFQLSINPWNNNILTKEYFYLPEDLDVEEGQFVEVTVGKWDKTVVDVGPASTLAHEYYVTGDVENIVTNPNIPFHSYCDLKTFQNYYCQSWEGAEIDNIHWTVPLQLVSCPALTFSVGGVGSKSIQYDNLMEPVKDLQKMMAKACPPFMRRKNSDFVFRMVNDGGDVARVKSDIIKRSVKELSYNIAPMGRLINDGLFVSLPTLIKNSFGLQKQTTFDLDYYDYLLSTHLINPVIDKDINNRITKYIQEARDNLSREFEIFNVNIDPHTYTRIGMAYCRMNRLKKLDEYSLSRSNDIINEVLKDYFDQLKHLYTDEISNSLINRKKISKSVDWRENLNKNESTVLSIVEKKYDQEKEEVLIDWIHQSVIDLMSVDECDLVVNNLINKGYLYQPNGVYSVVPIGHD